jgi:two-component system cell cycle sensor histidine kinase/response regulator CckA
LPAGPPRAWATETSGTSLTQRMTDSSPPEATESARAEALLACLPGLLYVAESRVDRPLVHASDGSLELSGYVAKDLEAKVSLSTLVHAGDRDRVDREMERLLAAGGILDIQYRLVRADGSVRRVWDRAFLAGTNGGPCEVRGCLLDVTERSHLEGRNYAAQRHEAVGRISAGVAHQFNNLLTAILGSIELALKDIPPSEPAREELREAQGAGQKAVDLIQQLLAFTRPLTWKPAVVDLNDVLRTMEGMLHRILGSRVRLVLVLDPGLPPVSVDPRQIEHVILNLAMNAQEAMPSGGRIVIASGLQELPSRALRKDDERAPGRYVTVAVTDNGEGIPNDLKGAIFEPFFTTRQNRNGLGLSTAYGIVKQSGGMIRVSSTPGRGSTFTVFIPAAESAGEAGDSPRREHDTAAAPKPVTAGPSTEPTALVVEDEESVRSVLIRMLSRQGFHVLEAPDGESAIRISEKYLGPIDLLLCDIMLPGIRGVEVARTIASTRAETRVLFASGYVEPTELERLGVEVEAPLLHKPFTLDELVQVVSRLMSSPPATRPAPIKKADGRPAGNGTDRRVD